MCNRWHVCMMVINTMVHLLWLWEHGADCYKATMGFFTKRSNLHFKPKFTSRGYNMFQKKLKLPPMGVGLTTLTITHLGIRCLCNWTSQTCVTWQTFNLSLFHVPFHFLDLIISKIIRACLMYILAYNVKYDLVVKCSPVYTSCYHPHV